MSLFLWAATCGSPSGYFLMSFVAQYRDWRTVFWALLGICGGFWLLLVAVLKETRHTTILKARTKKQMANRVASPTIDNASTQSLEQTYRELTSHRSVSQLFSVALTRPVRMTVSEHSGCNMLSKVHSSDSWPLKQSLYSALCITDICMV